MRFRKPCQYCDPDVQITYSQLPVSGKQISDDEFFHTVNVSFALVTDSVKTTQSQMLSLHPHIYLEGGKQIVCVCAVCAIAMIIIWYENILLKQIECFILLTHLTILFSNLWKKTILPNFPKSHVIHWIHFFLLFT